MSPRLLDRSAVPDHAWRYLVHMLKEERERLSRLSGSGGNMLPLMAAYDSLNELDELIPEEFHDV